VSFVGRESGPILALFVVPRVTVCGPLQLSECEPGMSQKTDTQATRRWWQEPQVYAPWIGLVGVVAGVVLAFVGQSILAARSIEHERENRLWRERTAAFYVACQAPPSTFFPSFPLFLANG